MKNVDIQIVVPSGALGASPYDTTLDAALRVIADAAEADPRAWAEKYGAQVDNDVFLMHSYCWCERKDCRWCSEDACGCEHKDPEGWLDGEPVASWWEANKMILGDFIGKFAATPAEQREWKIRIEERDRRLKQVWPERTHYCQPLGLMADRPRGDTWLPPQSAPNFWHKPSGFKVWWYKYIGRSMETVGTPPGDLVAQCLASLGSPSGSPTAPVTP